jgi:hypothetical protein
MGQAVNTQKDAGIQNKAHYQNHGLDLGAENQPKHACTPSHPKWHLLEGDGAQVTATSLLIICYFTREK